MGGAVGGQGCYSGWDCLWVGLLVGGAVIFTDLPVDMTVTRTREQSSLLTWWRSPEAASGRWVRGEGDG